MTVITKTLSVAEVVERVDEQSTKYDLMRFWYDVRHDCWNFSHADYVKVAEAVAAHYYFLEILQCLNE